jgi:hypothetical protein
VNVQIQPREGASGDRRSGSERRQAVRYRCLRECTVHLEGASPPVDWTGMVYNISANGIGLALPFPALPGSVLLVRPWGLRGTALGVSARVVRSGLQSFVWFHGCQFAAPLGDDELRRWLIALRAAGSLPPPNASPG